MKLGQTAAVTTDTYPGKTYEGRVSFIASEAEFTPKNVQTQKERVKLVYRIKIDIDNPDMELKPGMPADAEIVLDIAVGSGMPQPRSALRLTLPTDTLSWTPSAPNDLTKRFGDLTAVDGLTLQRAPRARSSAWSGPTAPARPPPCGC